MAEWRNTHRYANRPAYDVYALHKLVTRNLVSSPKAPVGGQGSLELGSEGGVNLLLPDAEPETEADGDVESLDEMENGTVFGISTGSGFGSALFGTGPALVAARTVPMRVALQVGL